MCEEGDDGELRYAETHHTGTEPHYGPENCLRMLLRRKHLKVLPTPVGDGGSCEGDGDPAEQLYQIRVSVNCYPSGPDRMRATDHRHNYKPVIELPLAHHPPAHKEAGSHEEAGDDLDGVARGQDRRAFVGGRHLWRQRHDYYKTERGKEKRWVRLRDETQ